MPPFCSPNRNGSEGEWVALLAHRGEAPFKTQCFAPYLASSGGSVGEAECYMDPDQGHFFCSCNHEWLGLELLSPEAVYLSIPDVLDIIFDYSGLLKC